ncbi:H-NS histone family protein [Rheinheimera riviphila]|uniref:H-NS histone family protein n=1 Tax=Rheinheimera riviphila TaxID=1834037 RepID=A0A437R3A6_9GAMM|nr:H-NS histone family protein [Rheinheimera riviphila]RVU41215.1 H-NS histone family protein [Rheinheimera riviphila]
MSLLLDKRELKKAAKELSVLKLQEVMDVLTSVMEERQNESVALDKVREFAKAQGFTLEQLGYKQNSDGLTVAVAVDDIESHDSKRPVKPKFKTINKDSQFFYVEGGSLQLLKTHTMKKGLNDRGIDVVPFSKVEKKYLKQVDALLEDAGKQALVNFNQKVDIWNDWAQQHGEEILVKR